MHSVVRFTIIFRKITIIIFNVNEYKPLKYI